MTIFNYLLSFFMYYLFQSPIKKHLHKVTLSD